MYENVTNIQKKCDDMRQNATICDKMRQYVTKCDDMR